MNPHARHPTSLRDLLLSFWRNRQLIVQLTKRDAVGRYKGSIMGLLWSFLNPIFMLAVYTFFFSVIFKSRWPGGSESKTEFALILFAGLMIFNLFSECMNKAPGLVILNVNYVKKIVFPLEILPLINLGSASFHMLMSLCVWLLFYIIFFGIPKASIFLLPVILLPFFIFTLGLSWFIASLGVYLRDLSQIVGLITTALMFLSPIFYPVEVLPVGMREIVRLNPLTFAVEQARNVMIWGGAIAWSKWAIFLLLSVTIAWLGYVWFQKTRRGFADVL